MGFMGAGKSTVGARLARRLGLPFIDLDQEITRREGMTPAALIEGLGVPAFRARERAALDAVLAGPPAVLACGGGTPTIPGALDAMARWGFTVFLDAPIEVLAARVGDAAERPLWGPEAAALYAARRPIYERALIHARSDADVDEVVHMILGGLP